MNLDFARVYLDPMGMYEFALTTSSSNLLQRMAASCVVCVWCVVSVSKREGHGKAWEQSTQILGVRARAIETDSKSKTMSVLKTGSY
jgi:hypothetical protein